MSFSNNRTATVIMLVAGMITILYSLITDYEYSIAPRISMKTHLMFDASQAIFLIASPWMFAFREDVQLPHLILGISELLVVSMTQSVPKDFNKKAEIKAITH